MDYKDSKLVLDLSVLNTERYFIFGDLRGEYKKLIDILYEQNFNYKDTVVTTGNIIDSDTEMSLDCLYFIKNCKNTYSVKGKKEFDFLSLKENELPNWINVDDRKKILGYLEELPVIIKVTDFLYVVNSGIDPTKPLDNQDNSVFYSIGDYDKDSRFYQFENPDKKSWYEFDIFCDGNKVKYCFGGYNVVDIEQPAGYSLGRDINSRNLKCLIISKEQIDKPILLET